MKFYNYLNEKLIKMNNKDIDMIYKPIDQYVKLFQKAIEYMENDEIDKSIDIIDKIKSSIKKGRPETIFSSDKLISKKAKMAHAIKPVLIEIYAWLEHGNSYSPLHNLIKVGMSNVSVGPILKYKYSLLNDIDTKRIKHEFDPERIKSSIRHEITHWVDDAIHGGHLTNLVQKAVDAQKAGNYEISSRIFNQGYDIVNLTDKEINAIVNQIDQIRKELGKKLWNMLTWEDLETRLSTIYTKLYSAEVGYEFRKKLKKRMAREGILGKNMR